MLINAKKNVSYGLDDSRLSSLHVAGSFAIDQDAGASCYRARYGNQRFQVHNRTGEEVVRRLNDAWPATVPVRSLTKAVTADIGCTAGEVLSMIEFLLVSGSLRFRMAPIKVRRGSNARPRVQTAIRSMALRRADASMQVGLFNQWHEYIADPGPVDMALLELADGERSREDLIAAVRKRNRDGQIRFFVAGAELTESAKCDRAAAEHVDAALERLRLQAMLE